MKLKLTLVRPGGAAVDLISTVEGTATVGDLAQHLANVEPNPRSPTANLQSAPGISLAILDSQGSRKVLLSHAQVGSSGLHSGATIVLTQAENTFVDGSSAAPAAVARVVGGPDTGREFTLARGTNVLGRGRSCEVRLSDPLVSRQHARINVTDVIEIVDLGSSNGVVVGDGLSARAVLRPGDVVRVGDTSLSIRALPGSVPETSRDSASIPFNRSPRLDPFYEGEEFVAPEPPERQRSARFPLIPLLAPVFMGAILYLVTHSLTSIIFVALSPILMAGNAVESRVAGRRAFKASLAEFRHDLAGLVGDVRTALATEATRRDSEHPSTQACVDAVRQLSDLVWTRRPRHRSFLELRLGLGRQPARLSIELSKSRTAPRALWTELLDAVRPFETVEPVPVVGRLRDYGAIGVAGPREYALAVARALVVQVAALHSPAEVVVAGFCSTQSAAAWDWLKWLPHSSSPHCPVTARLLASSASGGSALVSEIEELLLSRGTNADGDETPLPAVLVIVEDDAPVDRSRLVWLAERGPSAGVFVIWVAPHRHALPASCQAFVEVSSAHADGSVGFVHTGESVAPVQLDRIDGETAMEIARSLSPLTDSGALIDDASDLPSSVAMLSLTGRELASSASSVIERWVESGSVLTGPYAITHASRRPASLRAVVGQSAGEQHVLDLRTQGPHALVGGTTGSGKSELLQSWILGMAAAHSPQRVTFLLVDYKGGSAFRDCVDLPHTIGLVTDLSPHLVRRALTSLAAELRFREHILAAKGAKDLIEIERRGDAEAPPSLVIVVDEFAALVQEVPEFVDGVVNVAQRGRSLGLHLVLATQRPAGVIKDNLRANTNLRVALRMADEDDSTDVLGTPQAASFDPALPGRAVSKTGPGRLVSFQAAYAGGWTTDAPPRPQIGVEELVFGTGAAWEMPEISPSGEVADPGPTDIQRIVTTIISATKAARIPEPRKPWLAELSHVYDLAKLPTSRRDDELVFAVADDPEKQAQPVVGFLPDRDGNLAVYGTGGSGKSTLLRSIAIAAGFTVRGGPCHVYGLDFGARGLHMLDELPHVGSVVPGTDHERVIRLIGWLRQLVAERAVRYAQVRAGTITDYRQLADAPDEARILVVLDGLAAFRQAYEVGEFSRWFDALIGVANDGRPVGVHLLVSTDRPAAVPSSLGSAIQRRIVLRLADENDYGLLGLPNDVLVASSPPGRGLLDGAEIQTAVFGGRGDVVTQSAAVSGLAESMVRAGVSPAPEIRRLTERVYLHELPTHVGARPVLGVASESLAPTGFHVGGSFLVTGPLGSGRTTTVLTMATALRRWRPDVKLHYFGSRRSALSSLFSFDTAAVTPDDAVSMAVVLATALAATSVDDPPEVVIIEGIAEFVNGPADFPLQELAKTCLSNGHFLLAEGETSSVSSSYPLLGYAKSGRAGIALQPDQLDGNLLFRANFPKVNRADFPCGRGLHVSRGLVSVVQVAMPSPLADQPVDGDSSPFPDAQVSL